MSIASTNQQLFASEVDSLNMFEHKVTAYRFAVPYKNVSPTEQSNFRFRRRMKYAVQLVNFRTFARLSYATKYLPAESVHVKKMLNRLGTVRRRKKQSKIDYVWKIDYGDLYGRPHYHILMTCTVDYRLLREKWEKGQIWIEYVRNKGHAMSYVYKYMSKSNDETDPVKRRYGCSRANKYGKGGIPKLPPPEYAEPIQIDVNDYHKLIVLHNERLKTIVNYTNTS